MDHTGTLAHTAQSHSLATDLCLDGDLFGNGIGGHNGMGCIGASLQSICLGCHQFLDASGDLVYGNLHTDDTGGCNQYGIGGHAQQFSGTFCFCFTAVQSLFAGAGIGDSRIDYHCLCKCRMFHDLLIPQYRSRLYHIGGKSTSYGTRCLTYDQCHILTILIFNGSLHTCCLKAFCCGHTALDLFHVGIISFRFRFIYDVGVKSPRL